MKKIGPPHSHYVLAAEGWLELGNSTEAKAELARLPARLHEHPDVLKIMWAIAACEQDWALALDVARIHVSKAPDSVYGWIHQAYALRRAPGGGLQEAWDALFPAMAKFPEEFLVPYNLACYACQLHQPDKARILLKRAMSLGEREHIKHMALKDSDLKPLWDQIKTL